MSECQQSMLSTQRICTTPKSLNIIQKSPFANQTPRGDNVNSCEQRYFNHDSTSIMRYGKQYSGDYHYDLQEIPQKDGESVDLERIEDTTMSRNQNQSFSINSNQFKPKQTELTQYSCSIQRTPQQDQNNNNHSVNYHYNSNDEEYQKDSKKSCYDSHKSNKSQSIALKTEVEKSIKVITENWKRQKQSNHSINNNNQHINMSKFQKEEQNQKQQNQLQLYFKLTIALKHFFKLISQNLRIFYKLTELQHSYINDQASFFIKNRRDCSYISRLTRLVDYIQLIFSQILNVFSKLPVFSPYNKFRLIWDCCIAALILIITFIYSIIIFFDMPEAQFADFFKICLALFNLNFAISLNTAVVVKGKQNFSHSNIIKMYFKNTFFLDQIGMLPLYFSLFNYTEDKSNDTMNSNMSNFSNVLILLKLIEFNKIVSRVISLLYYQKNMKNPIDLLRLVFIIGCICHIFCLFWYGLANYEISIGRDDTWLNSKNLANEKSILIKYIYSFYFLSVTMITVGYGDITPQNPIEMAFTILTMFVTGFFWAYSLNKIGKIISNSEMQDKSYKESMQVIHTFMREENVDYDLRGKVSNYLQYFYKESNEVQKNQESEIINQLSDQLKSDLMQNVKGKYLKQIPLMHQMVSQNKVVSIMKEQLYSPGECIIREDELDDCSLYYLFKGDIEIILQSKGNKPQPMILKTLTKQNYFGELEFLTGNRRSYSVVATDFCRVYKIERQAYLDVLKQTSSDYEQFCIIKEAITLKNNYNFTKISCYSCNSRSHTIQNCPKVHFTVSSSVLALRAFRSIPHDHRVEKARSNRTFNSLSQINSCLDSAFKILNDEEFSEYIHNSMQEGEVPSNVDELISEYYQEQQMVFNNLNGNNNKISQINNKKNVNNQEDTKLLTTYYLNDTVDNTNKNDISNLEVAIQFDKATPRKSNESDDFEQKSKSSSLIIENDKNKQSENDNDSTLRFHSEQSKRHQKYSEDKKIYSPFECMGSNEKLNRHNGTLDVPEDLMILDIDDYQSDKQQKLRQNYQRSSSKKKQVSFKSIVEDSFKNHSLNSDNIQNSNEKQHCSQQQTQQLQTSIIQNQIQQLSLQHQQPLQILQQQQPLQQHSQQTQYQQQQQLSLDQVQQTQYLPRLVDSLYQKTNTVLMTQQNSLNEDPLNCMGTPNGNNHNNNGNQNNTNVNNNTNCMLNHTNSNTSISAQQFFRQIKTNTIQQIKKVQQQQQQQNVGTHSQYSLSSRMQLNTMEDIRRKPQFIDQKETRGRSSSQQEECNTKKSLFEDRLRKNNIKEDQQVKKNLLSSQQTSFTIIDQIQQEEEPIKLEEFQFKKYPTNLALTEIGTTFPAKIHESSFLRRQLAMNNNNYDNSKIAHNILKNLEWDYFQLLFFEKAKIFNYYHPLQNYNIVVQKMKAIHSKRFSKRLNKSLLVDIPLNKHFSKNQKDKNSNS